MRYISVGQASIDRSILPDGSCVGVNLGGPGVFGYTGIRLFDDDCQMILNIAKDFEEYYGAWIKKNHVNTDALYLVYDKTHAADLIYREDGSYLQYARTKDELYDRATEYGWTNVRPEQIAFHTRNAEGLYIYLEPTFNCFWEQLRNIQDRNHLRIMYEISIGHGKEEKPEHVLEVLDILKPEMASLNHNESSAFFGLTDKHEIFKKIYALHIPMFFYRAGSEGSYVLWREKDYFMPSIDIDGRKPLDATGCGNTSTAAAMYAWIKTENPIMTAIMANIAAGYNVSYTGIIKDFTPEQRKEALGLAERYYNEYVSAHPEYVEEGFPSDGAAVLEALHR